MKTLSTPLQAVAAVLILAAGAGGGALAVNATRPSIEMAPLRPIAIRALPSSDGIVAIRARVAEVYGNKFVADDGTARTLVDLGREGDEQALVADGQTVTAQGRFGHGVLHASFLVDAAGTVRALGPAGGPPHHHGGPDGPGRPDGPPPPPRAPGQADAPPPPPPHA